MMMEGFGSVPLTNGSGSGRPKNLRIRNTAGFVSVPVCNESVQFTDPSMTVRQKLWQIFVTMRERQLIIRPRPVERACVFCVCALLILPLYVRKYIFIRRLPSRQRFCIPPSPLSHTRSHSTCVAGRGGGGAGGLRWP
jgi:hypothetical protein